MSIPSLPEFEEQLLYALYEIPLLKKSISDVLSLEATLDTESNDIQVVSFVLSLGVASSKACTQLILSEKSGFIDNLKALKRLELDSADWPFLDMSLEEVESALPTMLLRLKSLILTQLNIRFKSVYHLPQVVTYRFKESTEHLSFSDLPLSCSWATAWKRFVSLNSRHLNYLGFTLPKLEWLREMRILGIHEAKKAFPLTNEVTETRLSVSFGEDTHVFHWLDYGKPLDFRPHIYVDSEFRHDEETNRILPTGIDFGVFFNLPKEHGYELEKLLFLFLASCPELYRNTLHSN